MTEHNLTPEERIARLEGRLGWGVQEKVYLDDKKSLPLIALGVVSLIILYLGTELPNHYYQPLFAIIFMLLAYHRNFIVWPAESYHWLLTVLNVSLLSMILKIFIGGGTVKPFSWVMYPAFQIKTKGEGWLDSFVPDSGWNVVWQQTELTAFIIDISIIQTFLLVLVILSVFFTLEIIASLLSILLVILSIPTLLTFDWDFVVLGMLFTGAVFYLQLAGDSES